MWDAYGRQLFDMAQIDGMHQPVRCLRCNQGVYDLGTVEVTARYADCSVWKAPCCGSVVDDRGETGWKTFNDYVRLGPDGRELPLRGSR